jgi:hypothetical protein
VSQQEKKDKETQKPKSYDENIFPKYVLVADVNKIKNYIFASVRLRHIVNASALLAHVNETLTRHLVEKEYGGKIIFTGGGVTQAIFTNKEQADACKEEIEAIYPQQTATATTVAHVETWEKNEEFVDVIRRALRKVRQKKDAATVVDSEAKKDDSKPMVCSQPTFEPIAFSSGSPFFRICAQTGEEFATRWEEVVVGEDKQEFGQSVWKQQVWKPEYIDKDDFTQRTGMVDFHLGDRLKADSELREQLAEALKAQGIKLEPNRFKYSTDFEEVTKDAKPQNYLGFMDADGNGFGDVLSKLANAHATEKDYESFSNLLEETTREAYIEAAARVLVPFLREQINRNQIKVDSQDSIRLPIRLLIMGGDDVLVVTMPQLVLPLANEFCRLFQEIADRDKKSKGEKVKALDPFTMSAGVVIAHHKFPFLSFQRLGNNLLKNAKKRSWAARRDCEGFYGSVDYQLITASGADDLKPLRKEGYTCHYEGEHELSLTGKPYLVSPELDELRRLRHSVAKMKKTQISRRQIKSLYDVLRWGEKRGLLEFLRWFDRLRKIPNKLMARKFSETQDLLEQKEIFKYLQREILVDLMSLLLFSVEMEGINLDNETIPPELRNQFESHKIPLSVEVQRKGSRWFIKDQSRTYIIQKEQKLVSCYQTPMLIPSPWLVDERLGKFKRSEHYTPLLDAVELFDIPDELAEAEIGFPKKEGEAS